MKKIIIALAVFAVASQARTGEPLEIKGVATGMTMTELQKRPGWSCKSSEISGAEYLCSTRTETLAGAPTKAIFAEVSDGKVTQATAVFNAADFLRIREALGEKYGPGKPAQDLLRKDNHVLEWKQGTATLQLKFKTAIGEMTSTLSLSDSSLDGARDKARAVQLKKNKDDL